MRTDTHLAAIDVCGPDALSLLQGQLTADVSLTDPRTAALAAWLNPKGRVIAVLDIILIDLGYRLFVPESLADVVNRRLNLYKLRADVRIDQTGALVGLATSTAESMPNRKLGQTGQTETYDSGKTTQTTDMDGRHLALRIAAGLPWIDSRNTERYTAHQLNLDWSGAISFSKGCYSGQEIVARTEHRGRIKRRAHRLHVDAGEAPSPGTKLVSNGADVGEVICSAHNPQSDRIELLALLALSDADSPLALADGRGLRHVAVEGWPAVAKN